ncbi:MAG: helix-turn-helix transcriptional regulator [Clostridia bacterium]|nr:helix-turn-helix transcriptional regulator [Clostridia bacterium]
MEMKLADNIKKARKERSLTQEQLAEVLGVTTGAVYKWEAGLSVPDIELIMTMADFFDTSVDVLLGYEMKDNRLGATIKRLQEYRRRKDREGLKEAEMAIKKYPHSFEVAKESSYLYICFAVESGERDLFCRALELLERSRLLLPQNTDPQISEQTICGQMSTAYLGLNSVDKAVELLKEHNSGGLYNYRIGHILSLNGHAEEAIPYLSEAFLNIVTDLINTISGYINVYFTRKDYASGSDILLWGINLFSGLRSGEAPSYLDKINCALLTALSFAHVKSGREKDACDSLTMAKELAAFFDASPGYDERGIKFIERVDGFEAAYDDMGSTAKETVVNLVNTFKCEELSALWRSVAGEEDSKNE